MKFLMIVVVCLVLAGCVDSSDTMVGPETKNPTTYAVEVSGEWYGVDYVYITTANFECRIVSPDSSYTISPFTGYPKKFVCQSGDRIQVSGRGYSQWGDVGVTVRIKVDSVLVKEKTAVGWASANAYVTYQLK